MPKLTFYPLGNADCCLIDLAGGEKFLFDYADMRDPSDPDDKRVDLPNLLRDDLGDADRDYYDVVAITHLDRDHYAGSSEFFYLEHAKTYQGADRVKIVDLWVPAALICEELPADEDLEEARVIQAEARYRLIEGKGIRVFSRPEALKSWLAERGLTVEDRADLLTDAGQLVPGLTIASHGVEFFAHSPFADRLDDTTLVDRNSCSIVVQATFVVDGTQVKAILAADTGHEELASMVNATKRHNNEERLEWDIYELPHHCSYLSLGPEKGKEKTKPSPEAKWLFEEQGRAGSVIVSTSWPIPATDEIQPPHHQAAAYYEDVAEMHGGEFKVTMQHPSDSNPAPLVILIDDLGARVEKQFIAPATYVTSRSAPRAG